MIKKLSIPAMLLYGMLAFATTPADKTKLVDEVQKFIDNYTETFVALYAISSEAEWVANTVIMDGVDSIGHMNNLASETMSKHTGSVEVIEKTRAYLKRKADLPQLQIKQLEAILYNAANKPQTQPEIVKARIAAETEQGKQLYGFKFKMDGKEVTPNELDRILNEETDVEQRRKAWESSKEVGGVLKDGLENLVELRNKSVQGLDYDDYFSYQVSEYGMTTKEMMDLMHQLMVELRPLYRELHTWARHELAAKYGAKEVPELIPAHWISNRWAQDWADMVTVEGIDLDSILAEKSPEWIVRQSERFYVSLGFEALPESFYELSSLYPVDPASPLKKNTHASAWHMNLDKDIRSLMSVEANARWYETSHHELGHIYYYISYTNPEVPPLLRGGANRAFHEAVGSLLGLASTQKPFLQGLGLIDKDLKTDETKALLRDALNMVVFIPFSAGTMSHFERDLYAKNLSKDEYNKRWWHYVKTFQGVAPPSERSEAYCDAATKTHINDDAAQYYDYALSYVILHQLHAHISQKILNQDPRNTNYYGSKEVGSFLDGILKTGAVKDWREVMKDNLGEELSAKPMLTYFEPLTKWLKEQNKGRKHTLPELK